MNQLKYREELESALRDYRISKEGLGLLKKTRLVLLNGPSAVGRNTIIERLLERGGYQFIVSDTTRSPRVNNGIREQNGVDYWFRSEEEVLKELRDGEFLEAELIHNQQVSGISLRELRRANSEGKIAITDVDIGGFKKVTTIKPDSVGLFILPPSFDEWLRRLVNRGKMPREELISRLQTALRIFSEVTTNEHLQVVVNDQLEQTIEEVDSLAHGNAMDNLGSKIQLAQSLIQQTNDYLSALV